MTFQSAQIPVLSQNAAFICWFYLTNICVDGCAFAGIYSNNCNTGNLHWVCHNWLCLHYSTCRVILKVLHLWLWEPVTVTVWNVEASEQSIKYQVPILYGNWLPENLSGCVWQFSITNIAVFGKVASLTLHIILLYVAYTDHWGGWACFFASISVIGVVTAVIGDIAASLGCIINLKDSVTAITFVSLGTSLPGITWYNSISSSVKNSIHHALVYSYYMCRRCTQIEIFMGIGVNINLYILKCWVSALNI